MASLATYGMNDEEEMDDVSPLAAMPMQDSDLAATISKRQQERDRRIQQVYEQAEARLRAQPVGPDKSEKWLALAAALGRPTRSGSIGETIGNASEALLGYQQAQTKAERERDSQLSELQLGRATEELKGYDSLDRLALQYGKPQRLAFDALGRARNPQTGAIVGPAVEELPAAQTEVIGGRTVIKGPKGTYTPITPVDSWRPASKEEARLYGVTAGQVNTTTGEFKATPGVANKLTPAETGVLTEATETLDKGPRTLKIFDEAIALNDKARGGKLGAIAQGIDRWIPGTSDAERATTDLDQLVTTQALESLRATFGGNPTEGERKILLDIQGSSSMNPASRAEVFRRAKAAVAARMKIARQNVARVRQGYYSQRSQPADAAAKPRIKIISAEPIR